VYDFAQPLVPLTGRVPSHGQDGFHIWIKQAFSQDALPDHAGRPEKKDVHAITPKILV
jgi:hypothetical protein